MNKSEVVKVQNASSMAMLEKSGSGQVEVLCGPSTEDCKASFAGFGADEPLFAKLINKVEPSVRHLFEELFEE